MLLRGSLRVDLAVTIICLRFLSIIDASDPSSISPQLNLVKDLPEEGEGHSDYDNQILPSILDPFGKYSYLHYRPHILGSITKESGCISHGDNSGLLKESSGIRKVITSEYSSNSNDLSDQSPMAFIMEESLTSLVRIVKDFVVGDTDEAKRESEEDEDSRLLQSNNIFGGFSDLMQTNSHSVGLLSLAVLVHLAEMITTSLVNKKSPGIKEALSRSDAIENIIHFINNSKDQLSENAEKLHDPKLPQNLIDKLTKETGTSTSCVQLLFCKISPFIWALQNGVKKQSTNKTSVLKAMLQFLPHSTDYSKFSKECDAEFKNCLH